MAKKFKAVEILLWFQAVISLVLILILLTRATQRLLGRLRGAKGFDVVAKQV